MTSKKLVIADPENILWQKLEGLPEGVLVKILMCNEKTGAMSLLAKTDKKMKRAKHKHPSDVHTFVLQGKVVDKKVGEIRKGMYCFFPANVEHGPEETEAGTILFLYASGPI